MRRPAISSRLFLTALLAVGAPVAVVLIGLVAFGALAPPAAVIAGVAALVGLAVVLRAHLADLVQLRGQVEDLAGRGRAQPTTPARLAPVDDVSAALARLGRAWEEESEALKAAVAASETILDRLPDPLILIDRRRQVVRANRAAGELLGPTLAGAPTRSPTPRDPKIARETPSEDRVGNPLAGRDLAAVLRHPGVLEAADAVLADGAGRNVEFALPGAIDRFYRARVEPLPKPTPEGVSVILILHDLTEIRRAEQMRADFVANAGHELRTPLSSLLGYIETLHGAAREDPEARDRFLDIMQREASRMERLVEDLLSLSRIELHEHTAPTEAVDLKAVLDAVARALEPQAKARGVAVAIEAADGLPSVLGDADELTQVFQNLVDNAIKYGRTDSTVRVSARRAERVPEPLRRSAAAGVVAVAVSDEGEGIAREHLPRLTERFYRVDDARSRELGGTGLGLAIVKHIVSRHRGTLAVDSTPGRGSTFTVHLPAAPSGT